jgi:beta-glucanase (GH16 family)
MASASLSHAGYITLTDLRRATAALDPSGLRVYYGVRSSGAGSPPCNTAVLDIPVASTYRLEGLAAGTRYYVQVTARDANGNESACSSETSAVALADPAWQLVWSDEFTAPDGSPVDPGKWARDIGGWGWGNNEWQYYTDRVENARIEKEMLAIVAREEVFQNRNYTSARLKTLGTFARAYGKFEARIKLPHGQGIWPAFWMLGENFPTVGWPSSGEIDIMENVSYQPSTVHGTIHGPGYSVGASFSLPAGQRFADDFHVFGLEWEPDEIRWYVDGALYQTRTPADLPPGTAWVFDRPFFLLLNVAVGSKWPGYPDATTAFPQTMLVDYVRVYATSEATPTEPPEVALDTGGGSGGGGCFIATAAFGSPLAREVAPLRDFRATFLLSSRPGRALAAAYAALSPPIADWLRAHAGARLVTRAALRPVVWWARLTLDAPAAGFSLAALAGALPLGVALAASRRARRRRTQVLW